MELQKSTPSASISECCKAPIATAQGEDFGSADEIATCWYECTECKKPCDTAAETISDGFGSVWGAYCPTCGEKSMSVVRPGKVQCDSKKCYDISICKHPDFHNIIKPDMGSFPSSWTCDKCGMTLAITWIPKLTSCSNPFPPTL